ncbi:DUF4236 domain-containing protein [Siphonobacter aquaeclarae]|uniref:DUF4236 domain-containing protein n=1 Tax=Siphonobacter aquaeclarae TaxID=563176 RepID=A0A1G9Y1U4_9BACT|nr:DUF4236 domain-containing protein [Siphonobacter aquaeclarae]SDN03054.1 Protein of unknown function [Siphonobacter aquaeclarae]
MAWSFRKRIKIIPGVHLNVSKSGISTSIGVRGASITVGKNGTFLNTSIPQLGLYNRQQLSDGRRLPSPNPVFEEVESEGRGNIFSADVQEITTEGMEGIKEAILLAGQQRDELHKDLRKVKSQLTFSLIKRSASFLLGYGLIWKQIPQRLKEDTEAQRDAIRQIREQIANSYVPLDVDFDSETEQLFERVVASFGKLMTSRKIWDVTSAHYQDRVKTRSSASTIVKKREIRFSADSLPFIRSNFQVLCFRNANGGDLYFYPGFIVMYSGVKRFAVISFDELIFSFRAISFTETGSVPADSRVMYHTWAKVNKNGTRDKRFKANYQIPVVRYGEIALKTATGLNEEYEFSNYEYAEDFSRALKAYQTSTKGRG